jgi:hypothetical protein
MNNIEKPTSTATSDAALDEKSPDKHDQLSTYLNDHLAGSITIINLLRNLLRTSPPDKNLEEFLTNLLNDVISDRAALEGIMQTMQVHKHRHRKAAAWLAEKLGRPKLRLDDTQNRSLHLLEALELVEVGIEGKRELWQSLTATSEQLTPLKGINFDHLIQRAEEQHDRVEAVRVKTAKATFTMARAA